MTDDRVSILLVDDRPENLLALEAILEPLGQILVRAGSGPEALRQVLATDFAVMLLDVQMPGMNGFEVARALRAEPATRDCLLVAVSGYGQAEDQRQSQEAGFDRHLVKPVDLMVLQEIFDNLRQAPAQASGGRA